MQGSRTEFTLHTDLPPDTDFAALLREIISFPCEIDIRHVQPWTMHLLVAERYREGRVFLVGDAAHLVPPVGALGMNSDMGDAIDLSWKLAALLHGWGVGRGCWMATSRSGALSPCATVPRPPRFRATTSIGPA